MHVLFVSQDGSAPSGVSTYGFHLLRARRDASMLLLNADELPLAAPPGVVDRISRMGTAVSHDVRAVAEHMVAMVGRREGAVVIVPNTGDTPWSATVACVGALPECDRSRVRVLGVVHSDMETQYACAERHAAFASCWIAVSRRCCDELRRRLGPERAARIRELRYPMDLPPAARVDQPDSPLRLIYAGRIEEPQKRVSRLPEVFEFLCGMGVSFSAVVAGDGPARDSLKMRVRDGPARDRVSFAGRLSHKDLQSLFFRSDVLLLTSAYEGLPLVVLEAMAAGVCPVVMDTESGLRDVIEDGLNGCIVPQGSADAMAAGVESLDRDRDCLKRLRAAARRSIAEAFSPEKHFAQLERILDECLGRPPPDLRSVVADPTSAAVSSLVARTRESGGALAVYGAGMFGRKVVDACLGAGLRVVAMVDSDPARDGWAYRGLVCHGPDAITRLGADTFVVGSHEFAGAICRRIVDAFAKENFRKPPIVSVRDGK